MAESLITSKGMTTRWWWGTRVAGAIVYALVLSLLGYAITQLQEEGGEGNNKGSHAAAIRACKLADARRAVVRRVERRVPREAAPRLRKFLPVSFSLLGVGPECSPPTFLAEVRHPKPEAHHPSFNPSCFLLFSFCGRKARCRRWPEGAVQKVAGRRGARATCTSRTREENGP